MTFYFDIPDHHFIGYRVVKPYKAKVDYKLGSDGKIYDIVITLTAECLSILSGNHKLINEIEEACLNQKQTKDLIEEDKEFI